MGGSVLEFTIVEWSEETGGERGRPLLWVKMAIKMKI